jgi:hypothetical protein
MCEWCATHPDRVCVACTHRRRKAIRLLEDGMALEYIANDMRISLPRVRRLIEEEKDFRDLQRYRCEKVPVQRIQQLVEDSRRQDPTLTPAAIGTRAGYTSRIEFERLLGYAPTSESQRNGKVYPKRLRTSISVASAGRIVRALGRAPWEIEDL